VYGAAQRGDLAVADVPAYLRIFRSVVVGVQRLHDRGVVHFDLKCDNIFLRSLPAISSATPQSVMDDVVAIGDFGESLYTPQVHARHCRTLESRGTDRVKSPEMLLCGGQSHIALNSREVDRRRIVGSSSSSDVWSLGCLLFELLSGDALLDFSDEGAAASYVRATTDSLPVLTEQQAATMRAALPTFDLLPLLLLMLNRDASRRASLPAVLARVDALLAAAA
jgi:serine/threonine protein kinase